MMGDDDKRDSDRDDECATDCSDNYDEVCDANTCDDGHELLIDPRMVLAMLVVFEGVCAVVVDDASLILGVPVSMLLH